MSNYQSGTPSTGSNSGEVPNIGQRVEQIGSNAQQVWSDTRGALTDLTSTLDLKGRVQRNPYATLAAAAGVGYLIGGGLFTSLTARLLRMAVKLAAVPLVKDELLGMAENAFSGFSAGARGNHGGSGTTSA